MNAQGIPGEGEAPHPEVANKPNSLPRLVNVIIVFFVTHHNHRFLAQYEETNNFTKQDGCDILTFLTIGIVSYLNQIHLNLPVDNHRHSQCFPQSLSALRFSIFLHISFSCLEYHPQKASNIWWNQISKISLASIKSTATINNKITI